MKNDPTLNAMPVLAEPQVASQGVAMGGEARESTVSGHEPRLQKRDSRVGVQKEPFPSILQSAEDERRRALP
jgi:hypothetical protein